MDEMQQQLIELTNKVNLIYQSLTQLHQQIQDLVSEKQQQDMSQANSINSLDQNKSYPNAIGFAARMEHKDILVDGNSWHNNSEQNYERTMSPDTQIRRLTAQLTAAYNRIAALEEQLLKGRIHS